MAWWAPAWRVTEATPQQRVATGALGSAGGWDLIDGNDGFRPVGTGQGPRELPERTRTQAVADSIAGYRANPMARAIIDTYVAFMVGDSGVTVQCNSDLVKPFVDRFWTDPANSLEDGQELMARSALIAGEAVNEMMVGPSTGIARRSPIDPSRIRDVTLVAGNPLWHDQLRLAAPPGEPLIELSVANIDDISGLWSGDALYWPFFRTLETDRRGTPFLMPILDWLDSYDMVLSNLVDRTALSRFISMDVTLKGESVGDDEIAEFIRKRGGSHIPRSGTIEVHNDAVEWKPLQPMTGSHEDANTNRAILTNIAAGVGLAKTWLAEPEDANRATSITMAEPVRRRVGSVQNEWLKRLRQLICYQVDQLVAAGRLPMLVPVKMSGQTVMVPPSETVHVTGPQIAASDAHITAQAMVNLSAALTRMVDNGLMSLEAAQEATRKAWENFVGVPYREEFSDPEVDPDAVASEIDETPVGVTPSQLLAA